MIDPATVRVGSGQIASICGLSRWKSPLETWTQMMGLTPESANEQIDIGLLLEDAIARGAANQAGFGFDDVMAGGGTWTHRSESWAKATPDRWLPGAVILEAKNVGLSPGLNGPLEDWRKDHERVVPEYVQVQVQFQMEVVDHSANETVEAAYVGALLAGREIFVAKIVRDRELGADLIDIAKQFRERHILTGIPPGEADGSEGYSRYLAGRFPKSSGEWLVATPDDERLLEWYRRCQSARAQAEVQEALAKQKVQERIGGALGILGACGKVSWAERRGYDVKAHAVAAARTLRARWADDEG